MRKDILTSILAIVVLTMILGLIYPLAVTGVAQVAFKNKADGSMIESGGREVGSRLIAQPFLLKDGSPDPRYFQPRPSQTSYNPSGTFFNNMGPNNTDTRDAIANDLKAYLALEAPDNPGLSGHDVPVDAVTGSASGVDPHISKRNAQIQARRVAATRGVDAAELKQLISENTDGRFLGVIGEPGVNVLELNIALDKEASR